MTEVNSKLYTGKVIHRRYAPMRHVLNYRVYSLFADLDELPTLNQKLRLFSLNKFNVFSFYERDHGEGTDERLKAYICNIAEQAGLNTSNIKIEILCFPRVLGYAFNPLTVFFCSNDKGCRQLIIYQVNNTFGERQFYALPVSGHQAVIDQACKKSLYVSPFNSVEGDYHFRVLEQGDELTIGIALRVNNKPLLTAIQRATAAPLNDRALVAAFLKTPLMTLKVIAGIHLEAFILWLKGMKVKPRKKEPHTPNIFILKPGD